MAFVYAATHLDVGSRVAIKILRPNYLHQEQVVHRFLREAQAAALVSHPHVVSVRDFGISPEGHVFTVMEYLRGETLARTLERDGPLPWRRAKHLMLQICAALTAVHRAGIVHRDVTLANVFRLQRDDDPDFVVLVDFGIARMLPTAPSGESGARLTNEIEVFGTPAFMAPEQVRRTLDADPRSDIYSAGVVLFALLTGRMPFVGRSATHVLEQQVHKPPPPPSCFVDSIPRAAEAVVLRALEKDPDRRFQSAEELAAAIASVDDTNAASTSRAWSHSDVWSLVLGAVALMLALWLAFD